MWWRILPLEDGYDDISVGIGINWDDMLLLLIDSGLLFKTKRKTSNSYQIKHVKWDVLLGELEGMYEKTNYTEHHAGTTG